MTDEEMKETKNKMECERITVAINNLLSQTTIPYNSGVNYLSNLDLNAPEMRVPCMLLDMFYENNSGMSSAVFFSAQQDKHETLINRPIPNKTPAIKAVVADWDGTVGDYYEYIATAVKSLVDYISVSRSVDYKTLVNALIGFGNAKVATCFLGPSYFSVGGAKDILSSPELASISNVKNIETSSLSKLDDKFLSSVFLPKLNEAYKHIYTDTSKFFTSLHNKGVPIFIHTDSPLSETILKLEASGFAKVQRNSKGEITKISDCMLTGISTREDIKQDNKALETATTLTSLFREAGIDLIINTKEACKPEPKTLSKIQSSLEGYGYGHIEPQEMLMIGDFLAKDGAFAMKAGTYFAWPAERAIKSDLAVDMNKITASAEKGYRNNLSKQLEVFTTGFLNDGRDKDTMRNFVDKTVICKDYTFLEHFFVFKSPISRESLRNQFSTKIPNTPINATLTSSNILPQISNLLAFRDNQNTN